MLLVSSSKQAWCTTFQTKRFQLHANKTHFHMYTRPHFDKEARDNLEISY